MKAIVVREPGGPEVLEIGEVPTPTPGTGELLIRVEAAGVNRADLLQRRGLYPPPDGASPILGLEAAGTVEEVGPGCSEWSPGERACALLPGGGYSEYAVAACGSAMRVPEGMSTLEAAAIPEAFATAYQCLFWNGGLQRDETVLVTAGASGVGTAAIQLARESGARVVATASTDEKREVCRRLGAQVTIDYRKGSVAPEVLRATEGRGANLILDFVGASFWETNLSALATDGRIVLIGTLGGSRVEADLGALMRKRVTIVGTTLRARDPGYKARLIGELAAFAAPRFADRRLGVVLDSAVPWTEAAEAHRRMEANRTTGKIVLTGM